MSDTASDDRREDPLALVVEHELARQPVAPGRELVRLALSGRGGRRHREPNIPLTAALSTEFGSRCCVSIDTGVCSRAVRRATRRRKGAIAMTELESPPPADAAGRAAPRAPTCAAPPSRSSGASAWRASRASGSARSPGSAGGARRPHLRPARRLHRRGVRGADGRAAGALRRPPAARGHAGSGPARRHGDLLDVPRPPRRRRRVRDRRGAQGRARAARAARRAAPPHDRATCGASWRASTAPRSPPTCRSRCSSRRWATRSRGTSSGPHVRAAVALEPALAMAGACAPLPALT